MPPAPGSYNWTQVAMDVEDGLADRMSREAVLLIDGLTSEAFDLLQDEADFDIREGLDSPTAAGQRAYLGSVKETRAVHQWAEGSRTPSVDVQRRLRVALQAASAIAAADSSAVAQAWFQGLDPQLDDRSPLYLLREGDLDEVGPAVIGAARSFAASG